MDEAWRVALWQALLEDTRTVCRKKYEANLTNPAELLVRYR